MATDKLPMEYEFGKMVSLYVQGRSVFGRMISYDVDDIIIKTEFGYTKRCKLEELFEVGYCEAIINIERPNVVETLTKFNEVIKQLPLSSKKRHKLLNLAFTLYVEQINDKS